MNYCHQNSPGIAVPTGVTQHVPGSDTVGTSSTAVDENAVAAPQNKQLERVKYSGGSISTPSSRPRTTSTSSHRSTSGSQNKLEKQVASPFARQDIFYTGSVTSLHEYKASSDMKTYVQVWGKNHVVI